VLIDLHTHSAASDGTDSPAELVAAAVATGIDVLAITDHDTTAGWEAAARATPRGLTLVTGTEYSCAWFAEDGSRIGLHLLGYLFDPDHPELRAERERLRASRVGRARAIVDNLAADDYPITWDGVRELAGAGAGVVGRPHIAQALVAAGIVPDVDAAFADLLSPRSKHYVRKLDTDVFVALRLIRAAGGLTVFAHPLARRRGRIVSDEVIAAMAAAGLDGLEADHPDHDATDAAQARGLADDLGLVVTGSSDYHGRNKRTALAARHTDPAQYEALLTRRNTARSPIVLSS
jgi:predicted metal-dependent phosphoesterase TrpH